MYYLIDVFGGVVMAGELPKQFATVDEAENWADTNMTSYQIMEGRLGENDVWRPRQRSTSSAS